MKTCSSQTGFRTPWSVDNLRRVVDNVTVRTERVYPSSSSSESGTSDWLAGWRTGWLAGWLADCLAVCWPVSGCLPVCLTGWLAV